VALGHHYIICYIGCHGDINGFGYEVTTNDIVVNESTNYSCWPGYTYVSGNLFRTCLPGMLVLSGRRPTCELTCPSTVRQKCVQCRGETDPGDVCTFQTSLTSTEGCLEALTLEHAVSVALDGETCYEYACKETIDGWSSINTSWTARYTCSRGNLRQLSYNTQSREILI